MRPSGCSGRPRCAVTGRWELNDEQWAVVERAPRPAGRRQGLDSEPSRPRAQGGIRHRDDRAQPAQPEQQPGWTLIVPLPQTLESRAALRVDAQLPPPRHPMGISHRELPRLRPPCLSPHPAQTSMRTARSFGLSVNKMRETLFEPEHLIVDIRH